MFSLHALVFTALFAFLVLTSASPLQPAPERSHIPLSTSERQEFLDIPTDTDYSSTIGGCDGLTSVAFQSGYKPSLVPAGSGTDACVYKFTPGWPSKDAESVGKTLQSGGPFYEGYGSEIDTLKTIDEFHAHEKDVQGRDWIVMKTQPGTRLFKTEEYKGIKDRLDEARVTCRSFFLSVYTAVYLDAKRYIEGFGCVHRRDVGMGEPNVLVEFAENMQPTARLVEWEHAVCSPVYKRGARILAHQHCKDYASSVNPTDECGGGLSLLEAHVFCDNLWL